jgi:hypothetical protein
MYFARIKVDLVSSVPAVKDKRIHTFLKVWKQDSFYATLSDICCQNGGLKKKKIHQIFRPDNIQTLFLNNF